MSMLEYLEQDKENILNGLENAKTPEKAGSVIQEEMDRLLLKYNQKCELPACREAAASMLQTARVSSALVDTIGEIKVWEEVPSSAKASAQGSSLREKILLGGAALCVVCAMIIAILADPDSFRASDLLLALLLGTASPVLAYLAGRRNGKLQSEERTATGSRKTAGHAIRRTESHVDAGRIYTCLHNVIFAVDQNLDHLMLTDQTGTGRIPEGSTGNHGAREGGSAESGNGLSPQEISLFSGLLEAEYSKDGSYALEKIGDVRYYLHQNRIEAVDYNGSNAELFDFMPSSSKKTLRPALVSGGVLIRKGLAAGEK